MKRSLPRTISSQAFAGVVVGTIGGVVGALWIKKNKTINADVILENVKSAFLKEGPIEGSWIEHEAIFIDHIVRETKAYSGGIVRYEDDELVVYEFLADAHSGTILSISQLEGI